LKLLSLKLRNFKGVRSYEFQPNGENVTVKGKNGTGKSTLFDAMLWVLFGKDSQGKKDFEIKTLDKNNKPIPGLEHEVEAVFEINGQPLKLRKNFYEVWTQKRGSVKKEFSGHTTDHFVDDVAVPQKEYLARIDEIAKEDVFKLLTNPAHFASLDWKVRRKMLLDFCGDISNDDVIASDSKFSKLQEIIGTHKPEEYKSIAKSRQTAINGTLEKIPDRIDENQRLMTETPEKSADELDQSIELFKKTLDAKQKELTNLENGGVVAAKQIELQTIEAEIMALEQQFKSNINNQIDKKTSSIETLRQAISAISNNINTHTQKWNLDTAKAAVLEQSLADLRVAWKDIKERVFEF
jgi:DNA repair exonuclease SbcCD ATPase subunit